MIYPDDIADHIPIVGCGFETYKRFTANLEKSDDKNASFNLSRHGRHPQPHCEIQLK